MRMLESFYQRNQLRGKGVEPFPSPLITYASAAI